MERSPSMSQRVIIHQAKEELEMLESQHPNRFHSLKLDLKSFIFLHSQNLFLSSNTSSSSSPSSSSQPPHCKMPSATSSSATTQASSNGSRKRKIVIFDDDEEESRQKFQRVDGDRVDEVLKRAQVCLQRIKDLKTNFFSS